MKIEVKAACQQDIKTVRAVLSWIQTHDKIGVCNHLLPKNWMQTALWPGPKPFEGYKKSDHANLGTLPTCTVRPVL